MLLHHRSIWIRWSDGPIALRARILVFCLGGVLLASCSASRENKVPMPQPQLPFTVVPTSAATPGSTLAPVVASPTGPPTTAPAALPSSTSGPIEIPATDTRVTLPLHLFARIGAAGDEVTAELRWHDGTTLTQTFKLVAGEDQRGLLLNSLDWQTESQLPEPPSQPATLTLRSQAGEVLAQQDVVVLSPSDPDTRPVTLYWLGGDKLYPTTSRIPRTPQIGAATIEELLWGPPPRSLAGFTTALPTPQQVLAFPGRKSDWGSRVTLRKLTIVNGVATVDFSKELLAYGGSFTQLKLIQQQLTRTLTQFSTVREVRITIEGKPLID
jgi:spore germination protein GerM